VHSALAESSGDTQIFGAIRAFRPRSFRVAIDEIASIAKQRILPIARCSTQRAL
jgi:hypothetical protein